MDPQTLEVLVVTPRRTYVRNGTKQRRKACLHVSSTKTKPNPKPHQKQRPGRPLEIATVRLSPKLSPLPAPADTVGRHVEHFDRGAVWTLRGVRPSHYDEHRLGQAQTMTLLLSRRWTAITLLASDGRRSSCAGRTPERRIDERSAPEELHMIAIDPGCEGRGSHKPLFGQAGGA